jgi:hypothetical protein
MPGLDFVHNLPRDAVLVVVTASRQIIGPSLVDQASKLQIARPADKGRWFVGGWMVGIHRRRGKPRQQKHSE